MRVFYDVKARNGKTFRKETWSDLKTEKDCRAEFEQRHMGDDRYTFYAALPF